MSNPIFQAMGGRAAPTNGPGTMMQEFQRFRQNFRGDPRQTVEQMIQSGRITKEQVDAAFRQARQMGLIR